MAAIDKSQFLKEAFLKEADSLWDEHEKKFMRALEDSGRNAIQVVFKVDLDTTEAPLALVCLQFKDKTKEAGLDVTKTYKSQVSRVEAEDPAQPPLVTENTRSRKPRRVRD